MKKWLVNFVLKHYLNDFDSPGDDKEITEGQRSSALHDVYKSEHLTEFLSIRVANLIRRNLYASNMEENSFYRGQILALRWLIKSAEEWHEEVREIEISGN